MKKIEVCWVYFLWFSWDDEENEKLETRKKEYQNQNYTITKTSSL